MITLIIAINQGFIDAIISFKLCENIKSLFLNVATYCLLNVDSV